MISHAVIGLGFGDEGKGVVTEYLCSRNPGATTVVRFSGGHQCGHKVVKGGVEHIFSNFGSGTLSGCTTYWSEHCTFDPVGFWNEHKLLRDKGVKPRIMIDGSCPVTTAYDVFANRQLDSRENRHGTTGTGFFRTKERHTKNNVAYRADTCLLGPLSTNWEHLDKIRRYYSIDDDLDVDEFFEACIGIRERLLGDTVFVRDALEPTDVVVFEGSQGLLLDQDIGYFPHVTPSDVTPRNALELADGKLDEVWLVTRAYQTRHGNGPMTNEEYTVPLTNNERETNKLDKHQGEFRVSVLDLDQLNRAKIEGIEKVVPESTRVNLVVTCTDQTRPHRATADGALRVFPEPGDFARFVGDKLGVHGGVYVNTSPRSTTIMEVR